MRYHTQGIRCATQHSIYDFLFLLIGSDICCVEWHNGYLEWPWMAISRIVCYLCGSWACCLHYIKYHIRSDIVMHTTISISKTAKLLPVNSNASFHGYSRDSESQTADTTNTVNNKQGNVDSGLLNARFSMRQSTRHPQSSVRDQFTLIDSTTNRLL